LKTNLISKSETTQLLKIVSEKWKIDIPKVKNLKVYEIDNETQLITGSEIKILRIKEEHLPFLSEISTLEKFPHVQVDMGAIKFMCKGANLMRPGIKKFSEFSKDDIVCIVEESQNKFLAVGKAKVNSSELDSMDKGEVLKNLHYISDKAWEVSKTI
jgi:malignant T-cell-amplified sequence